MICKNCHKEHPSCKDQQDLITDLQIWKYEAQTSLNDWHELGSVLSQFFDLQVGDNIPKTLVTRIRSTAWALKRLLNL